MKQNAPCYGCQERSVEPNCHMFCQKYLEQKKKLNEKKKLHKESEIESYEQDKILKKMKERNKRNGR